MYAVDIQCSNGHIFEGWFANRAAFEKQRDCNEISCTICSDANIKQVISAPRIKKHSDPAPSNAPQSEQKPSSAAVNTKLIEYIEKNFDDVGNKFAEEAIKIHYGETDSRGIRGTATAEEQKEMKEEGINFLSLPEVQ